MVTIPVNASSKIFSLLLFLHSSIKFAFASFCLVHDGCCTYARDLHSPVHSCASNSCPAWSKSASSLLVHVKVCLVSISLREQSRDHLFVFLYLSLERDASFILSLVFTKDKIEYSAGQLFFPELEEVGGEGSQGTKGHRQTANTKEVQ